jgi:glycosyltransferase involved in cell wall biosynthesis
MGPSQRSEDLPTIALLPGSEVWEDFLDTIGVSLETFCREGPGGWMLGYIDALGRAGVRTALILFSARVSSPLRFGRAPGTTISVLPVPAVYRVLRHRLANSGGRGHRWLRMAVAHLSTPLSLLVRELRRQGCQAILCQEYEEFRLETCVVLGRLLRLPVFATFQGADFEHNAISRALRPLTIRGCAGLFVAASTEIARVRARYKLPADRVAQVFNPVDVGMWGAFDRGDARAALDIPPDARVAVWHGRVALESKGLDVLLDAWARVCLERPGRDLRLLLMGTGEDADQLRRRLTGLPRPNVLWRDEYVTDRSVIRRWLSAGDVYAFPSRYEGFAVAPIEAMACGLPVVAAEASGVPDIFQGGAAAGGIVVPRGDATAFAGALGRVLDDAALGRELGRRARQRAEQAFSLEAVGRQLGDVLQRSGVGIRGSAGPGTMSAVTAA